MRTAFVHVLLIFLLSCESKPDAQHIVNKTIAVHGGDKFSNSRIEFDFRNRHYVASRENGKFSYERIFKEGNDIIRDVLNNDGFIRHINLRITPLADTMAAKYSRSVNSTIYFASLPFGLNDAAVKKQFVGETVLDNEPFYKIKVTFKQEGGGEDHNDIFLYWIHKETFKMKYLAYQYFTEGGGFRFRKSIKEHVSKGITLQDFINYQPIRPLTTLDSIEHYYSTNKLEELSRIELENVVVN